MKEKFKHFSQEELINLIEFQQKTIAELKTDNDILRNIIAIIPGNVYWKDNNGRYLGCNDNVAHIFGFNSSKEIVGKMNHDLFDPRLAFLADQVDQFVVQNMAESYVEEIGLSINQEPAVYLSKKLALYNKEGHIIGILGVSFDITERKKMEEDLKIAKQKAVASSRAKSQFLAVVNHELRTPLASIVGLVEFIKKGGLSKIEKKNIIHAIENCTQHLLTLVNEILDFSRLESGKYTVKMMKVNLKDLLHEVYDITKTLARKKDLSFQIKIDSKVPINIFTDIRILRQILINLVSNAIKFTEEGGIKIAVIPLNTEENKIHLKFRVSDSGIGIPNEKLELIFEPFQQLENAYTRQSSRSGTGLGLAIVKKLIELIGCKSEVKSEQGKGSSFALIGEFIVPEENLNFLNTPKVLINENHCSIKKKRNEFKNKKIYPDILDKKPSILLIEDDPIVQYVHKKMLIDMGCEVDVYSHGYEALDHFNKSHDMILVDISLPDISGFEVIRNIRQQKASLIPIIALTVYTGKEEKQASKEAGADAFSSKPISHAHLKKLIAHHLSRNK